MSSIVAFSYKDSSDILVNPAESSNAVVKAAAQFLASKRGKVYMTTGETHASDVTLAGVKYYIDTAHLSQSPYDALNLVSMIVDVANSFVLVSAT
jgi:hypothetical protein